jgi:hypothetical protein
VTPLLKKLENRAKQADQEVRRGQQDLVLRAYQKSAHKKTPDLRRAFLNWYAAL